MTTIKVKEMVDLEEENKELDIMEFHNTSNLTQDKMDKRIKSLERREVIANTLLGISIGLLIMTILILYRAWRTFG